MSPDHSIPKRVCRSLAALLLRGLTSALKNAGFPADDLRIVILQPKLEKQTHAVVAIRTGNRWLVIDNRTMVMADSKALLGQNIPLFTLDDRGVRQFTVRIASRDLNGCEAGT